jgi:uncharacterized membrane protein (UPF0127 family)
MEYRTGRHRQLSVLYAIALGFITIGQAAAEEPLAYSRSAIQIQPSEKGEKATASNEPLVLNVEVRKAGFFQQPGMFYTRPLSSEEAFLEPLPDGDFKTLERGNVYEPMDVCILDAQGKILQIYPSLILNDLAQSMVLEPVSKAVLYLPNGRAVQLGLKPGTVIQHPLFVQPPKVIE